MLFFNLIINFVFQPDEVESIRLGPGGKGLQSWGKGSSGGNRASVDPDMKTALTNR